MEGPDLLLVHLRKLDKKEQLNAVNMIIDGISLYNTRPKLLHHTKMRSIKNRTNNFIIIREKKELVGFLMYRIETGMCFIYEVHVKNGFRSKGYGKQLMNELKDKISKDDEKINEIVLFVHKDNLRAQQFYEQQGFKLDGEYNSKTYLRMKLI